MPFNVSNALLKSGNVWLYVDNYVFKSSIWILSLLRCTNWHPEYRVIA